MIGAQELERIECLENQLFHGINYFIGMAWQLCR